MERDYQLPWKRGIGNESRKIWDANGRLVCMMETSADSTFLVERINNAWAMRDAAVNLKTEIESYGESGYIADTTNAWKHFANMLQKKV